MSTTRSFTFRPLRKIVLSLAALCLLSGCSSFTAEDPRSGNYHELWWLGGKNPQTTRWPAAEVKCLDPMPVESLPPRTIPQATPSPGWPPL